MKWTARDDRAYQRTVDDHQAATEALEQVRPYLAALGIDPDTVRVAAVYRVKPCRHVRCIVHRWWKRVTR